MQFQDLLTDTQTKYSDQTKYVQKIQTEIIIIQFR